MALAVGMEAQQDYFRRFGLFDKATTELPEVGSADHSEQVDRS
ncbi:MAG: hypothetical protein R3D02_00660 [Hyphomicrobiales bacterium]